MPRGHPGISGTGNASISVGLDWSLCENTPTLMCIIGVPLYMYLV